MQDHNSSQRIGSAATDVLIRSSLNAAKQSRRLVANVATSTSVDAADAAVHAAVAERAEGVGEGRILVAYDSEVDFEEAEMVDDGCGDGYKEKQEGGDEEEEDPEAEFG